MAEKLTRYELRRIKAERDANEAKLRGSAAAARERFDPLNLSKEAAGHIAAKAKTTAAATKKGAEKHKFKVLGGAVLAAALLAYRPIKKFVAKKKRAS